MEMRAHEIFVGQVEPRRGDLSGNHAIRALEEILVVRTACRAVREDQRRLAAAARSAAALGIVGGSRRNVPHVHYVQLCDVDAKLHGGRAIENRQFRFPEPVFADETILVRNLRGVLSGLKTRQLGRQRPVEVHEERIRPPTDFRFAGHANGVAEGLCAFSFHPKNGRCRKAVAVNLVGALRFIDDLHQARQAKSVEELTNDLVHFRGCEPVVILRKSTGAPEVEAEATSSGDKHIAAEIALASRSGVKGRGVFQEFVLVQGPWRDQPLTALLLNGLLFGRVEIVHLNSQFAAHEIQKRLRHGEPGLCRSARKRRVEALPG